MTRATSNQLVIWLIVIGILLIGFILRLRMIQETIVHRPIRADAALYYSYAYNLKEHGVYSQQRPGKSDVQTPTPDAKVTPGYPLFLLPFVKFPPTPKMMKDILTTQAIISTMTILVALGFLRAFLRWPWALSAAFMVAVSPHLVTMNAYVLTESLFTFFLVLFAYAMTKFAQSKNRVLALVIGLLLGCTSLIKPTLLYFIVFFIPALFVLFRRKGVSVLALFVFVGFFASYGPWAARNVAVGIPSPRTELAFGTIHGGIYPNLTYNDNPRTYGNPLDADPEAAERQDMNSVLKELWHRFKEEPQTYIGWYSVGKPTIFFSWNMAGGIGDVFVYPVLTSPYHHPGCFDLTHRIMKALHWPLVVLALLTGIWVWFPIAGKILPDRRLIVARLAALIIAYCILVHIAGTPLPRYSIPLRPFIYGMAMLGLYAVTMTSYRSLQKHKRTRGDREVQYKPKEM